MCFTQVRKKMTQLLTKTKSSINKKNRFDLSTKANITVKKLQFLLGILDRQVKLTSSLLGQNQKDFRVISIWGLNYEGSPKYYNYLYLFNN